MTARMFTAVLPPQEMIEELSEMLRVRRESSRGLRWTRPEGWHLTTSFMAKVKDIERLTDELAPAVEQVKPFQLRVETGIAFPHSLNANVVGLAVTDGAEQLRRLATKCKNAANRAGANPDGSKFRGHLTLFRAKAIDATNWLEIIDSLPGWGIDVEKVALVQSHDNGRFYETVHEFRLGRLAKNQLRD